MNYGIQDAITKSNKRVRNNFIAELSFANSFKYFMCINGRDVETKYPNQFTTSKRAKEAINPLFLK